MPGRPAALDVRGLTVRYPSMDRDALRDVSLLVEPGSYISIAGRNGAGKSTFALAAAGLLPRVVRAAVQGSVEVDGTTATAEGRAFGAIPAGLVLADPAAGLSGARATVREEVAFGLENLGVDRGEMDGRIDRALAAAGSEHLADRAPESLSGGEQQRVAIAGAIAMERPLLVLDEATAELDAAASRALADQLFELAAAGVGVVAADHALPVLSRAVRTLVLDDGVAVALAAPMDVLGHAALRGEEPAPMAWDTGRPVTPSDVEIRGVSYRYPSGIDALREIALTIEPGESVAVVGGNGSGKSTLAKHLIGLLRPTSGSVAIAGRDIRTLAVEAGARTVGFLFQDPRDQLFGRTVERAVGFGPGNLEFPAARVDALVDAALAATGLTDRRAANPHELDLAARKQVALAGTLAMDPALVVLDEPTSGQDLPGIRRVEAVIHGLRAAGRTIVAITHDLELAARAFDRIIVLRRGELIDDGPPDAVLSEANAALLATTGLVPANPG